MKAVFILLMTLLPGMAQTQADYDRWPILAIKIEGAKRYSPEQVLAISRLKTGVPPSRTAFEAARDHLMDSGGFETVAWRYIPVKERQGYNVILEVSEVDQLLPWTTERLPITDEELAAAATRQLPLFGPEIPTTERYITRLADIATKLAAARGFADPIISVVQLNNQSKMAVVLKPKTTPPPIMRVRFTGPRVVFPQDLTRAMSDVARDVPYTEAQVRLLLKNQIVPIYEAVGRLRVTFPTITTAPAPDNPKGVVVTVEVEDGPAYELTAVEVQGAPMSQDEIKDLAAFPIGKTANFSDVGKGMQKILNQLRNAGYLKAGYATQRKVDDQKKTVELAIQVDPGRQYTFGRLTVKGLDIETEPAIRKIWALKPGDPFPGGYPENFLQRVRERGLFDNLGRTRADTKINEDQAIVDVILYFSGEERPAPKQ